MEVILGPTNIKAPSIKKILKSLFMREKRTIEEPLSFSDLQEKMINVSIYDIRLNQRNTVVGILPLRIDINNAIALTQVAFHIDDNAEKTIYSTVVAKIPQKMLPEVIALFGSHSEESSLTL